MNLNCVFRFHFRQLFTCTMYVFSYKTVKRTVKISKIIPLKADIACKRFPIKFRLHFLTSSFSKEKKKVIFLIG